MEVKKQEQTLEEVAMDQIFFGIPPPQRAIAVTIALRYGLDPVLKHVIPIKFGSKDGRPKWDNYITKAGLLHVAHQSGQLAGFEFKIAREKNPITDTDDVSCTCIVHRNDMEYPISSQVWLSEYKPDSNKFSAWVSHTHEMLKKVALVSAFRMAFDVSIPAMEEMDRVHEREEQRTMLVKAIPKKEIQKYPESLEMYQEYCKKEPGKWNLLLDAVTDYCKDGEIRVAKGESPFLYCSPEQVKDFIEIIG